MIREATTKDFERIAEILVFSKRMAYRSIFQDDNYSFNTLTVTNVLRELEKNITELDTMMVYDDGIVKGFIRYGKVEGEDLKNICEIKELYVDYCFQKQGIGKQLMDYVLQATRKTKKLVLWVLKDNPVAIRLYQNFGFEIEPGFVRSLSSQVDEIRMAYVQTKGTFFQKILKTFKGGQ